MKSEREVRKVKGTEYGRAIDVKQSLEVKCIGRRRGKGKGCVRKDNVKQSLKGKWMSGKVHGRCER